MADSRAQVPTFALVIPSKTLTQNFTYVFVTIIAALLLKRLFIFVWYCISSLGDWFMSSFENTRTDDLPSLSRMPTTEEDPDKFSCEGPHVEAGSSSGTSRIMYNKGQKYDKDMKDYEDILKLVIEGKDKEEEAQTMRNSIADFVVADEIDRRFRENLAEKNRKFNEEMEEFRQQTRSIEKLAIQDNQELHCRKSLLPRLDDD